MKLTIDIDENAARGFVRGYNGHPITYAGLLAEAIAAALPPQARPIQPGDRIRYKNDEGVWLGRHRDRDVIWWDSDNGPSAASAFRLGDVTHEDGTPVAWGEEGT